MVDTSHQQPAAPVPNVQLGPNPSLSPPPEEGKWGTRIVAGVVLVAVLGGGAWGAVALIKNRSSNVDTDLLTATVQRSDLVVTVVEDGNLESAVNIDIKCQVAGGSSILWIVEDGKEVKEGEKLVELDSAALEESINGQRIAYEKARAAKIQAEKNYAAAKLAVDEYLQGTFVKELQDQETQITIALENLRTAQNTLNHSERMFRKGYISKLDLDTQEFAVKRSELELESARTAKMVLEQFTKTKMVQELESARDSAEAQMRSEGASFDLEESRLERLEAQMEHCLINAPASGMVVYANDSSGRFGGSQAPQVEEGAMVRERQDILKLPDLAKMQVKVNVHESKVEMLGRAWKRATTAGNGLRAQIRIQDRQLEGTLTSIANQPEPSGWWTGNIKEYATIVTIDGKPEGLRPGMTAECEILVEQLRDVLLVPVAAVVTQKGEYVCWVKTREGPERRPLMLGATNDKFVQVEDGVTEGELVVLNPRAKIPEARGVKDEEESVNGKFAPDGKPAAKSRPGSGPPGASKSPGGMSGGKSAGGKSAGGKSAGGPGATGGDGAGARGGAGKKRMDLMQFDSDGDGKISKDEAPSQMQQFFDQIDADSDGFITRSEAAKIQTMMGGAGKK